MESFKRKYKKRNLIEEAQIQTDLLTQQKAREDFLFKFANTESPIGIKEDAFTMNQTIEPCDETPRLNKSIERQTPHEHINANARQILEKWMYDHRFYCYPNKTEKLYLAKETQLSMQKVSNWFINSRRRMLPKLLETEGKRPLDFMINRKARKQQKTSSSMANLSNKNIWQEVADLENSILASCAEHDNKNISFAADSDPIVVNGSFDGLVGEKINEEQSCEMKDFPLTIYTSHSIQPEKMKVFKGMFWNRDLNHKFLYLLVKKPAK